MTVQFKVVRDWDDEKYWQSNVQNNGEFDYYLIITCTNVEQLKDIPENYYMSLWVIAPSQVSEETRDSNFGSLGLNDDEWDRLDKGTMPEDEIALNLCQAGCGANVWWKAGNNKQKVYAEAKDQAQCFDLIFGVYLYQKVNDYGTTGWEMLRGDSMAGYNRMKEARNAKATRK